MFQKSTQVHFQQIHFFFLKKTKILGKLRWNFLNKHTQIRKENEKLSTAVVVSPLRNGRNLILYENKTLNPRVGN